MSAVIVEFPKTARANAARLRAVREAIAARAKETNATAAQKFNALQVALVAIHRGESAGWAMQLGYRQLPAVRQQAFRQPTFPTGSDAA